MNPYVLRGTKGKESVPFSFLFCENKIYLVNNRHLVLKKNPHNQRNILAALYNLNPLRNIKAWKRDRKFYVWFCIAVPRCHIFVATPPGGLLS
jgi:hypothetical protein